MIVWSISYIGSIIYRRRIEEKTPVKHINFFPFFLIWSAHCSLEITALPQKILFFIQIFLRMLYRFYQYTLCLHRSRILNWYLYLLCRKTELTKSQFHTVLKTAIPTVQYFAFGTETHSSYAPLHLMFPTIIRGGIFDQESITENEKE